MRQPDNHAAEWSVALRFTGATHIDDGRDIGFAFRESCPDTDVRAVLDERGAVAGYDVILHFDDEATYVDSMFRLRALLDELGLTPEITWGNEASHAA